MRTLNVFALRFGNFFSKNVKKKPYSTKDRGKFYLKIVSRGKVTKLHYRIAIIVLPMSQWVEIGVNAKF